MQSPPIEVKRDRKCIQCGCTTPQQLIATAKGCSWKCLSCNYELPAYTFTQMQEIVQKKLGNRKDVPKVEVPEGYRVFMQHHGPGADEKEISLVDIKKHVELCGELPKVGKPLLAPSQGLLGSFFAVPYGEVTRIEEK